MPFLNPGSSAAAPCPGHTSCTPRQSDHSRYGVHSNFATVSRLQIRISHLEALLVMHQLSLRALRQQTLESQITLEEKLAEETRRTVRSSPKRSLPRVLIMASSWRLIVSRTSLDLKLVCAVRKRHARRLCKVSESGSESNFAARRMRKPNT